MIKMLYSKTPATAESSGATRLKCGPLFDWQVAMMHGKCAALKYRKTVYNLIDNLEKIKANIRAKEESPFWVIKCQFGYCKTRYRSLINKNGATDNAVCAEQPVDGEKKNYSGSSRIGAPAAWANVQKVAQRGKTTGEKSGKYVNHRNDFSSSEIFPINSRFCGG
jgi:hypothetical protein